MQERLLWHIKMLDGLLRLSVAEMLCDSPRTEHNGKMTIFELRVMISRLNAKLTKILNLRDPVLIPQPHR